MFYIGCIVSSGYVINEIIGDDFLLTINLNNTLSERILLYLQTKDNYLHSQQLFDRINEQTTTLTTKLFVGKET